MMDRGAMSHAGREQVDTSAKYEYKHKPSTSAKYEVNDARHASTEMGLPIGSRLWVDDEVRQMMEVVRQRCRLQKISQTQYRLIMNFGIKHLLILLSSKALQ